MVAACEAFKKPIGIKLEDKFAYFGALTLDDNLTLDGSSYAATLKVEIFHGSVFIDRNFGNTGSIRITIEYVDAVNILVVAGNVDRYFVVVLAVGSPDFLALCQEAIF